MFLFKHQFKDWVRDGNIKLSFTLSGEEALIPLDEDKGKDIILILSDINMLGINGFELLRKVKKSYPDIKTILITAYSQKAKDYGASDFFEKPLNFVDLKEKIVEAFPQALSK